MGVVEGGAGWDDGGRDGVKAGPAIPSHGMEPPQEDTEYRYKFAHCSFVVNKSLENRATQCNGRESTWFR